VGGNLRGRHFVTFTIPATFCRATFYRATFCRATFSRGTEKLPNLITLAICHVGNLMSTFECRPIFVNFSAELFSFKHFPETFP
jgi:hypothetical protein